MAGPVVFIAVQNGTTFDAMSMGPSDLDALSLVSRGARRASGNALPLRCYNCNQPVFPKQPEARAAHFAHYPGTACNPALERLVTRHRVAVNAIVEAARNVGWHAETESVLGTRRADVMAEKDGRRVVFEVQLSSQTRAVHNERTREYEGAGAEVVWLLAEYLARVSGLAGTTAALEFIPPDDKPHVLKREGAENRRNSIGDFVTQVLTTPPHRAREQPHRSQLAAAGTTPVRLAARRGDANPTPGSATRTDLIDLGIDPRVADLLASQGIESLYPPQEEAWAALKDGDNVLVAIPTASGKSLIAYLAMLHRFIATGKKALYIVPLRALASEKYDELKAFASLGLKVGIATGDLDERDPKLGKFDVIVCTSEKADALLRHRTPWVQDIGCVVADELHLIHDPGRGPTLEVLLTRFRAVIPDAQIVGLSATIANAPAVAEWLGAKLVTSTWRPVDLKLGTYLGNSLEFLPPSGEKRFLEMGGDPVASLVEDAIAAGGQCLVFVSTRKSAEAQAKRLAGTVGALLDAEALAELEEMVKQLDDGGEGSPTTKRLQLLCKKGACYHTAGLDAKQRRFVETAFREGKLKVLCATPTLAAGVNTPARRVIIRDWRRFQMGAGSVPLPVMEVHQMMGRAGRPRYDPYGEAVLLAKSDEEREMLVEGYLLGQPEPVSSKLAADAALRIHTLASVAGGYCDSFRGLRAFMEHTFWAQETDSWIIEERLDDVVWFLEDNGFLERDGGLLKATLFGRRTSDLYIDPLSALRMRQALEGPGAPTTFGLLEVIAGCPDVYPLYLRKSDEWVQERFWEHEDDFLVPDDLRDLEQAMSYTKTALLLSDWANELHLQDIEERYQIGPGDVRQRVDTSQWLVHAFRELARALKPDWQQNLSELGIRLEAGVKAELLPLLRLDGVGRIRARTLFDAGFKRPANLKGTPVARLAGLRGIGPVLARRLLKQVGDDPDKEPAPTAAPAPAPASAPPLPGDEAPTDAAATPPKPDNGQVSLFGFDRS